MIARADRHAQHAQHAQNARFAACRRVRLNEFLAPDMAPALQLRLQTLTPWVLVTRIEGVHRAFDAAGMAEVDAARRSAFDELVWREARQGFSTCSSVGRCTTWAARASFQTPC